MYRIVSYLNGVHIVARTMILCFLPSLQFNSIHDDFVLFVYMPSKTTAFIFVLLITKEGMEMMCSYRLVRACLFFHCGFLCCVLSLCTLSDKEVMTDVHETSSLPFFS